MAKWTDERVSAVIQGRLKLKVKHIPQLKCDVAFRLLTEDELDGAKLEAQRYAKRKGSNSEIDPEFMERELERQLVWRSVFDADTINSEHPEPFFPSDADVRSLDSALVRALSTAYMECQEEANPALSLSKEQVDELVAQLGKEQAVDVFLNGCEHSTLRLFVRSMAQRLRET